MPETEIANHEPENLRKQKESSWDWREHIPLLITGFSILFIGIRLISISHGDIETADGILQSSGTATVVIGALMPVIGFIIFTLGFWLLAALVIEDVKIAPKALVLGCGIFLVLTGLFVTPISFICLTILAPIAGFASGRAVRALSERSSGGTTSRKSRAHARLRSARTFYVISGYILLLLFVAAINPTPWIPAEIIASTTMRPFTGYVISDSQTDVVILVSHDGKIVHIDPTKITSQVVCRQQGVVYGGFFLDTLPMLINATSQAHYPACPS